MRALQCGIDCALRLRRVAQALPAPEQNEAIARLCSARLVDAASTAGTLRLTVQLDDVKAAVKAVPRLAHLFPTTQA